MSESPYTLEGQCVHHPKRSIDILVAPKLDIMIVTPCYECVGAVEKESGRVDYNNRELLRLLKLCIAKLSKEDGKNIIEMKRMILETQ